MCRVKRTKKIIKVNGQNELWVTLEEYKALRAEILQTMGNRNTILTFSFAALGATLGAAVIAYDKSALLSFLLVSLVAPVFSTFCFLLWVSETYSIVRTGNYIKHFIEEKIIPVPDGHDTSSPNNNELQLLYWETFIHDNKNFKDLSNKMWLVFEVFCYFIVLSDVYVFISLLDDSFISKIPLPFKYSISILFTYFAHLKKLIILICFAVFHAFLVLRMWRKIGWLMQSVKKME